MSNEKEKSWLHTRLAVSGLTELREVDSTNLYLLRMDAPAPFSLVLSMNQTEGVGRHGRPWVAAPGECLALSLVVPYLRESTRKQASGILTWLPLLAGVSAIQGLNRIWDGQFELKWPNDVLREDKKIAGILTQPHLSKSYVVGLGLNLRFSAGAPSSDAGSLEPTCEVTSDRLDDFVAYFVRRLREIIQSSPVQANRLVTEHLATLGRQVLVEGTEGKIWEGRAEGLGPSGELIVENSEGRRVFLQSGTVRHLRMRGAGL